MWWSVIISKILTSSDRKSFDHDSFYSCLVTPKSHASCCSTHFNLVLWPVLYKIHCNGLFGSRFHKIWAWAPNLVLTGVVKLSLKWQNLVSKLVITLNYKFFYLFNIFFIGGEFWQILNWITSSSYILNTYHQKIYMKLGKKLMISLWKKW